MHITEYNVIGSGSVTWITNQITSCQKRVRDKDPGAAPGRQSDRLVCEKVCVHFWNSILLFLQRSLAHPLSICLRTNSSNKTVWVCWRVMERRFLYTVCDECVRMTEVWRAVGNRGRCASLLFGGSLRSDFSPVEPVWNCQPKYQLTINHQSSAGGSATHTHTHTHTHCHTHVHTRMRRDNEVLLSFEYLISADD